MSNPTGDPLRVLRQVSIFRSLDEPQIERLVSAMTRRALRGGEVLMHQGDESTELFIVEGGRLRAYRGDPPEVLAELGAGDIIGEMGILGDVQRTATVYAVRDSVVWSLSRPDLETLVEDNPSLVLGLCRGIFTRVVAPSVERTTVSALALLTLQPEETGEVADTIVEEIQRLGTAQRVRLEDARARFQERQWSSGQAFPEMTDWLDGLESSHDFIVYDAVVGDGDWASRCARQADRILLLVDTKAPPDLGPIIELYESWDSRWRPPLYLVLTHEPDRELPSSTRRLVDVLKPDAFFHVRKGRNADAARIVRCAIDEGVGLVLAGGGARGMAHIGVIRALSEAGIPIDTVGGTSFGAVTAAALAMGWDLETITKKHLRFTVESGRVVDLTLPLMSLAAGGKITSGMRSGYGDIDIADLWHPYFCIAKDLLTGNEVVIREGPLWRAVRASTSIPGIFPPVPVGESLCVDGGLVNNFPADHMRRVPGIKHVIGIVLSGGIDIPMEGLSPDGVMSGWTTLWRRIRGYSMPSVAKILSSVVVSKEKEPDADLLFHPPVEHFGLFDFKNHEAIIRAGYDHARERLSETQYAEKIIGRTGR